MDTRILIYEGYLRKSPPEKKIGTCKWRKRYFRLWDDKMLEYYKKETKRHPVKQPLDLTDCLQVCDAKQDQSKYYDDEYRWPFCLQMPGRLYYLLAGSEEERRIWKEKICALCSFGMEFRNAEYATSTMVDSSRLSPNSSSNSSHTEEQRSGSESSGTHTLSTIMHNAFERTSTISDTSLVENEHSYNELPPPRVANINSSRSFGAFDNSNSTLIYNSPNLGASYNDGYITSNDCKPTNRSFTLDTNFTNRSLTHIDSDVFPNYDVPPVTKSKRKKQQSTKCSASNEIGYVTMDPSVEDLNKEDYIEMQGEHYIKMQSEEYIQMHGETYIAMHGASSPNELMNRGSVKEFKPIGSTLSRLPSVQNRYNNVSPKFNSLGKLATSFQQDIVFDDIPEISRNKRPQDTGLEPPTIDRKVKPCPTVDRTTKPKVGPLEDLHVNYSESDTGYFYFSTHDSDEYENASANTSLTSNDYFNISNLDDKTRYIEQQNVLLASNKSQYNPGPYSSHKSNDEKCEGTDYYRDTTKNHNEDIVLYIDEEYAHKNLPYPPIFSELEKKYEEKHLPALPLNLGIEKADDVYMNPANVRNIDDCYENIDKPLQNNKTDEYCFESIQDDEESYENVNVNVNDINQKPAGIDDGLKYIHCSPQLQKGNKIVAERKVALPPISDDNGYVRIDPIKSAAATNLR